MIVQITHASIEETPGTSKRVLQRKKEEKQEEEDKKLRVCLAHFLSHSTGSWPKPTHKEGFYFRSVNPNRVLGPSLLD